MGKLSRIPCPTCNAETIHDRLICVHCGNIFVPPTWIGHEKRKLGIRRKFARHGQIGARNLMATEYNQREYLKSMHLKAKGMLKADLPLRDPTLHLHKRIKGLTRTKV